MAPGLMEQANYIARTASSLIREPRAGVARVRGRMDFRNDRRAWEALGKSPADAYEASDDAHAAMHEALGASWPCDAERAFEERWQAMLDSFEEAPEGQADVAAYQAQSEQLQRDFDADPALARAAWCAVRHVAPRTVVETGVARGVTSRFLLEALEANGPDGRLWSIDLPHPHTTRYDQLGSAVPERLKEERWTIRLGTSAEQLPPLLDELGEIDMFVHDSLHTSRNVRFELESAWRVLRPGGVVLLDDIHTNLGFRSFVDAVKPAFWVAGRDRRREGLWGMALKPA